jgi:hypothetical protein
MQNPDEIVTKLEFDDHTKDVLLMMWQITDPDGDGGDPASNLTKDFEEHGNTLPLTFKQARILHTTMTLMTHAESFDDTAKEGTSEWCFGRLHDHDNAHEILRALSPWQPSIPLRDLMRGPR